MSNQDDESVPWRWREWAPRRFWRTEIEQVPSPTRDELQAWVAAATEKQAGNLLLFGPLGVGKTHAAMAVCRELLRADVSTSWWPLVELLQSLRPGHVHTDDYGNEYDLLDFVCSERVAFLDDLGGEKPSDWVVEQVYTVVNRRWMEERPLIATSNLTAKELRESLGARSYDRLRDGATAIEFSGESLRGS